MVSVAGGRHVCLAPNISAMFRCNSKCFNGINGGGVTLAYCCCWLGWDSGSLFLPDYHLRPATVGGVPLSLSGTM